MERLHAPEYQLRCLLRPLLCKTFHVSAFLLRHSFRHLSRLLLPHFTHALVRTTLPVVALALSRAVRSPAAPAQLHLHVRKRLTESLSYMSLNREEGSHDVATRRRRALSCSASQCSDQKGGSLLTTGCHPAGSSASGSPCDSQNRRRPSSQLADHHALWASLPVHFLQQHGDAASMADICQSETCSTTLIGEEYT